MKRKLTHAALFFLLSLSSACSLQGGKTAPLGNGEAIMGRQTVASLSNSAVRCQYHKAAGLDLVYETECSLVVMQSNGEVLATGIEAGLVSAWPTPAVLSGAVPDLLGCTSSDLRQTCRVGFSSVDDSQIQFSTVLTNAASGSSVTHQAVILFPYSVETYGIIPGLTSFQPRPASSTTARTIGRVARFAGEEVNDSDPSPDKKLGVQNDVLITGGVGEPNDVCAVGNRIYFSSGAYVYSFQNGEIRLFAGSRFDRMDLSHRTRYSFFNGHSNSTYLALACNEQGVYISRFTLGDLRSRQIFFASEEGPLRVVAGGGTEAPSGQDATRVELLPILGMALGADGTLYLAEPGISRVLQVDPQGKLSILVGPGGRIPAEIGGAVDLALDGNDSLYIASSTLGKIFKVNLKQSSVAVLAELTLDGHSRIEYFENRLYVKAGRYSQVSVGSDGSVVGFPNYIPSGGVPAGCRAASINLVWDGMAVGPQGLLLSSFAGCGIRALKGGVYTELLSTSSLPNQSMVLDYSSIPRPEEIRGDVDTLGALGGLSFRSGKLGVSYGDYYELNESSKSLEKKAAPTAKYRETREGIELLAQAEAPDGTLYLMIADRETQTYRCSLEKRTGTGISRLLTGIPCPKAGVVASDGKLYLIAERLYAFEGGALNAVPGLEMEFNQPKGLAIDTADNLYIADNANRRIARVQRPSEAVPSYSVKTLFGGSSTKDCVGSISSKGVTTELKTITSNLCFSSLQFIAVDSSACGAGDAKAELKVAFSNQFDQGISNIVLVKSPCP